MSAVIRIKNKSFYMGCAVSEARKNFGNLNGGPFGACIVKDGRVLARAHNTVLADTDATSHAEINAIHSASRKLKTYDLSGCIIFSTTEPCPMCFSAIHWARIGTLVYGATIRDARICGFNELAIPTSRMKALGKSPMRIERKYMYAQCKALLVDWKKKNDGVVY